jgi:hypothetical protein
MGRDGHPVFAVEQMLRGVVRAIPNERLGVNNEPGLSLRSQDVARVEIGREQRVIG